MNLCPLCGNNLGDTPYYPCICGWRGPNGYSPLEVCQYIDGQEPDMHCNLSGKIATCQGTRETCTCYFDTKANYFKHYKSNKGKDTRYL